MSRDLTYRINMIDRLNRAAQNAQNNGRWEEADNLLSMSVRFEALWESLEEPRKW